MNKEEDEEEPGLGEVISNIIRQLEGQIVWAKNRARDRFASEQFSAIDDQLRVKLLASRTKSRKIVRKDRRMACRITHLNREIS